MDDCRKSCTTKDTCDQHGCANVPSVDRLGSPISIWPCNESPQHEQVVYMLNEGSGNYPNGPYLGAPGLNFAALADQFRKEKYAEAEQAEKDHCWLDSDDFVSWLLACGLIIPIAHTSVAYSLATHGENKYVPKHWPLCPECGKGRGDECPGNVVESLNRWEWYRKCSECDHIWDRHDEPRDSSKPMLDDDGRTVNGGCVPYSISLTTGIPMKQVMDECRNHGWAETTGMYVPQAILAARQLGFELRKVDGRVAGKLTVRRVIDQLSSAKKYIVGTREHWFAVVDGKNLDQSDTSMRTEVDSFWEVMPISA